MMRSFVYILILTLTTNDYCIGQVIIEGKIHNYDGKTELFYFPTIEGVHSPVWKTTHPNPGGEFRIKYKNDGYGTILILFDELYYRFFHDGKSSISFELDQSKIKLPDRITRLDPLEERRKGNYIVLEQVRDSLKKEATYFIKGDYADVNNFYNSNPRTSHSLLNVNGTYYSYMIRNTNRGSEALSIIDSLIALETKQISALGSIGLAENDDFKKANYEVKDFLQNEVRAFYSAVLLHGMFLKRRDQVNMLQWNPDTALAVYNQHWEKLTEYFLGDLSGNIVPAANSLDFNELVLLIRNTKFDYQKYDPNFYDGSNSINVFDLLNQPDSTILDSILVLDEKAALAYRVKKLQGYFNNENSYSHALLNAYDEIRAKYPHSSHIKQFQADAEKVKEYLKSSAEKFNKAKVIETNYYRFEDLLELFKGQNLLIDIWATWCGPCIAEFKYKHHYKTYVDQGDLTVLYISIDKQRWEKKWRENMKYNQLEGYHVRANNVLIKDMWEFIDSKSGAIPRYVLIDKSGKIFIKDSAKPSQKDLFEEQIKLLLSS